MNENGGSAKVKGRGGLSLSLSASSSDAQNGDSSGFSLLEDEVSGLVGCENGLMAKKRSSRFFGRPRSVFRVNRVGTLGVGVSWFGRRHCE